jgi:sulfite reductase (ferredoxin)
VPVAINVNGCPNSCARFQIADIGLKGSIVSGPDGDDVEGFQVHLGGHLGTDAGFGRKLRGHKVTALELPDYVERLLTRFRAARQGEESFAAWVARAEDVELQ